MSYVLVFTLEFFNYLLGIGRKYSRFIVTIGLGLMAFWFAYATKRADFSNYEIVYELATKSGFNIFSKTEFGFYALLRLIGRIADSFPFTLLVIYVLCCGLRYWSIKDLTCNYGIILLIYLLYPAFSDIFEIRFLVSSSIVIFAFSRLLKKKYILFTVCVLLASTVHISSIIYLPFIIVGKIKLSRRNVAVLTLLTVGISFLIRQEFILGSLSWIIPRKAIYIIENARTAGIGWVGSWVIQIITFVAVYYVWQKAPRQEMPRLERDFIDLVCKINMCFVVILMFFMLNKLFYRIYKPVFFLNMVMLSVVIKDLSKNDRMKAIVMFVGVALINCLWHIPFSTITGIMSAL